MTDSPQAIDEVRSHGRVGYGQIARYSPAILAVVMVIAIIFIALAQRDDGEGVLRDWIGMPAPEMAMRSFDGSTTTHLSSFAGKVVVLNFWASWCEPCKREMPAFEAVSRDRATDQVIIGVNLKNDRMEDASSFLASSGVTYTIVKDSGGEDPVRGPIQDALGMSGPYPITIFVRPDGVIDAIYIGEMTESRIRDSIIEART